MDQQRFISLVTKYGRSALSMLQDSIANTPGSLLVSYRYFLDTEIQRKVHIYTIPVPQWVEPSDAGYTNLLEIDWNASDQIVGFEINSPSMLENLIKNCLELENNDLVAPAEQQKVLDSILGKF